MQHFPERVQTGGLTGQGFANLLGSPRLAPVSLVLREAAQNSWDARRRDRSQDGTVRFGVRIRTLSVTQERLFREILGNSRITEDPAHDRLSQSLRLSKRVRVLEIHDYGTVGLCGPTRPDLPLSGSRSRFVDFFFDVGKAHVESGDGGTYGFGRSSLYLAGCASTIIVDSQVEWKGRVERRLMGCRIGDSFEVRTGAAKGRYSGRHFWGAFTGGVAQPVTGAEASRLAGELGMPTRDAMDTGTTILIPWPVEEFADGRLVVDVLLRHLWPKMVPVGKTQGMTFDVEIDGQRHNVPDPAATEEYRLFVEALKLARGRDPRRGAVKIETLRRKVLTGHLAVATGVLNLHSVTETRPHDEDDEEAPTIPAVGNVALMRPSELVVKYLSVSRTELPDRSWAGVFICSSEDSVRTAFAKAEPPAHDDWVADQLPDKHERYLVRKSVNSLIPDATRERLGIGPIAVAPTDTDGPSFAAASARFSQALLGGVGQLPGSGVSGVDGNGGGSGNRSRTGDRAIRVHTPVPAGLRSQKGRLVAAFKVRVSGPRGVSVTVRGRPVVFAEARLDSLPEGLEPPTIVDWEGGKGAGDLCSVVLLDGAAELLALVAINGEYGLTLACERVEVVE